MKKQQQTNKQTATKQKLETMGKKWKLMQLVREGGSPVSGKVLSKWES